MIDVAALKKRLKKQRDFLRWMARRHAENEEQAAAFTTGAEILEGIRLELRDGVYDIDESPAAAEMPPQRPDVEEVFIEFGDGDIRQQQRIFAERMAARDR